MYATDVFDALTQGSLSRHEAVKRLARIERAKYSLHLVSAIRALMMLLVYGS